MAEALYRTISTETARKFLLHHLRVNKDHYSPDANGARQLLEHLRCIQLDSIISCGSTNHEMTLQARMNLDRDAMWAAYRGNTFEHYAKQRCLLPASSFRYYYKSAQENAIPEISWFRKVDREKALGDKKSVLDQVYRLFTEAGDVPLVPDVLPDNGSINIDWYNVTGKAQVTTLALEMLWQDLKVAIIGREDSTKKTRRKLYQIVEKAFPSEIEQARTIQEPFEEWFLIERVRQCGLMPLTSSQPVWCCLEDLKKNRYDIIDRLVASGQLEKVRIGQASRFYLAPPGFLSTIPNDLEYDDRVRILAPLDPLVWDRELVRQIWNFDVLWEASRPAAKRIWGYYICLLLYKGQFVGRVDMKAEKTILNLQKIWLNDSVPRDAVFAALERHARLNNLKLSKEIDPAFPKAEEETMTVPSSAASSATPSKKRKKNEQDEGEPNIQQNKDRRSSKKSKTN